MIHGYHTDGTILYGRALETDSMRWFDRIISLRIEPTKNKRPANDELKSECLRTSTWMAMIKMFTYIFEAGYRLATLRHFWHKCRCGWRVIVIDGLVDEFRDSDYARHFGCCFIDVVDARVISMYLLYGAGYKQFIITNLFPLRLILFGLAVCFWVRLCATATILLLTMLGMRECVCMYTITMCVWVRFCFCFFCFWFYFGYFLPFILVSSAADSMYTLLYEIFARASEHTHTHVCTHTHSSASSSADRFVSDVYVKTDYASQNAPRASDPFRRAFS